jgi:hypothetical protein
MPEKYRICGCQLDTTGQYHLQREGFLLMKKTWVYVLTGLLLCVLPISASGQQIQGQTINVDISSSFHSFPPIP